jgi:hypothetical protein
MGKKLRSKIMIIMQRKKFVMIEAINQKAIYCVSQIPKTLQDQ